MACYLGATSVARRSGYSTMGGRTVVRCRDGHFYRTWWVPGVSLKSLRLGRWRFQYCPVGRHWSLVTPQSDDVVARLEAEGHSLVDDLALP
jgi:hypothetical protein